MTRRKIPIRYTSIRVPCELRDTIKEIAKKSHFSMWELIYQAVTYYRSAYLTNFQEKVTGIGKISWYAYKISSSIGMFKENPSEENKNMLLKTAEQISQRLGVDISLLKTAITRYMSEPTEDNRILLNDAGKDIIAQLLSKLSEIKVEAQS
jgi:hypothetical protein